MKNDVKLIHEKGMKEKEVRENIDRAAAIARDLAAQRGQEVSQEKMREVMAGHAEKDKQRGKI